MRLCTKRDGSRDGLLHVVAPDGLRMARTTEMPRTLQEALDHWTRAAPVLQGVSLRLADGRLSGAEIPWTELAAPLPRAYEWVDGSAYVNHVRLVRRARGAEPPPDLLTTPLVYQGGSSVLLGPRDPIPYHDASWGLDFESEVCVLLDDVPLGCTAEQAAARIPLLCLANDVTLRGLVPAELQRGFGFFQSKPATAFSPFVVTPDELGGAWIDGRVHLRLRTQLDDLLVGDPEAGPEMHFSFFDLIAHIAKTRAYGAGTILGSGTVSNEDRTRGISCLAEARMRESLDGGRPLTPWLAVGQRVRIEMLDAAGRSVFGMIDQRVVEAS